MLVKELMIALCWASLSLVTASLAPLNSNFQIHNAPGSSPQDTLWTLRQALYSAKSIKRDTVFKNSTTLDKSWDGAVLFTFKTAAEAKNISVSAGVEITCTTCYIKGTATAQLTIDSKFNATQLFQNFTSEVKNDVNNTVSTVVHYAESYLENVTSISSFDINKLDSITIPFDLDLDIPDIPECLLSFQFDGLELYVQIDTTLSAGATYELSLYKSKTPIGISISNDLEIGAIFTIDLILSVEGEINISSGFHIKLDDGVALSIPMFGHNVSSVTFNGGKFEFLPVTIQSAGIVLKALLRVGARAGFNLGTPPLKVFDKSIGASSGVEVGVWANVAELITNVTAVPAGDSSGCELLVQEVYSLAIGAKAGATVAIDAHTWGPTPNTSIPIWYTTLASVCGHSATSTSSPAVVAPRATRASNLTTTTISTKATYTGVACLSTGMLNCPVSLQTTSKITSTSTLVTSVPSGSTATFPATTQNSVASTVAFGKNVKALGTAIGSPVSFVPTTTPTGGIIGVVDGQTGGVSNKVIIGVSVGVGLPVLIAIFSGLLCCLRRKRSAARQTGAIVYIDQRAPLTSEPYTPGSGMSTKKLPNVAVFESPH